MWLGLHMNALFNRHIVSRRKIALNWFGAKLSLLAHSLVKGKVTHGKFCKVNKNHIQSLKITLKKIVISGGEGFKLRFSSMAEL